MTSVELGKTVSDLLRQQQDIKLQTAVAVFAERQEAGTGSWQSLIPFAGPGPGQQYRFEVDLDECTGCKSCVTACHSLNGLDQGETWRRVGTLEQTRAGPASFTQTITGSCHHCLEPACAIGCPVKAYEKDPITGIVRHLDDQCIGCQYCVMMCPYDVPVYNQRLGIVRKCDMCSQRLSQGEAPACVQACPTQAISIGIVDREAVGQEAFLPTAADPRITSPTTLYKIKETLPEGLQSADHFRQEPAAAHQPLVWMLIFSQAGVGMLFWEALLSIFQHQGSGFITPLAVGLVLLALGAATLHLGQPLKAWRCLLGLKTSWMSREILAFQLFVATAVLVSWPPHFFNSEWTLGKSLLLMFGLSGAFCSAKIYTATRRVAWSASRCLLRFAGTTLLLGLFGVLLVLALAQALGQAEGSAASVSLMMGLVLSLLLGKCLLEARELLPALQNRREGTALLPPWKHLRAWTWTRWLAAWCSASALLVAWLDPLPMALPGPLLLAALACFIGEFCERSLFFRSSKALGMPGL